jgi:SAM-dependent methyltransferase
METHKLFDAQTSQQFYETRYEDGYMDDWHPAKKERVSEVIGKLGLPPSGAVLDYGCGNGVFTEVLQKTLPNWRVFGADISKTALANATRRYPAATFFEIGYHGSSIPKFDFIFSHHVLEHVPDLGQSAGQIAEMAAPNAHLLHILPCGNPGSFEHQLCLLRKDGVNPALGNRFFFEDVGHVRRLTSAQLGEAFAPFGFRYLRGFFANQYEGALDWISEYSDEFILDLTNPEQATGPQAAHELGQIRTLLFQYKKVKAQALAYRANGIPYTHGLRSLGIMLRQFASAYVSNHHYEAAKRRLAKEWATMAHQENGSEMYVALKR